MRNSSPVGCAVGLSLCLALAAIPAGAQLPEVSLQQLAAEAHEVVRGTVQSKESNWNADKTYIWTVATFKVGASVMDEQLAGQEIRIRVPGGTVGEITQRSSDQVDFEVGEDAVVFVDKTVVDDVEYYTVHRLAQGKLTVKEDRVEDIPVGEFLQRMRGVKMEQKTNTPAAEQEG